MGCGLWLGGRTERCDAEGQGLWRSIQARVCVARLESEVNELLVGCNVVGE